MKLFIFLFLTVFVALVFSQTPPKLSEVFIANGRVTIAINASFQITGDLEWASDQPRGRGLERFIFRTNSYYDTEYLQRYDLNSLYTRELNQPCERTAVNGSMPSYWAWLSMSSYKGTREMRGRQVDVWEAEIGFATVGVAVWSDRKDIPAAVWRLSVHRNVTIDMDFFAPLTPPNSVFDVPRDCPASLSKLKLPVNTLVGCVGRSTMISRAEVWVVNHVPYNQDGRYNGYREDCSGYVSDIWELSKPGYTTFTLPEVSHRITKADLLPGDVLLDVQEHVVLFGGWADASHSQYVAYEETRPGEGTVKRTTPYPYWYNTAAFLPYRYNQVC